MFNHILLVGIGGFCGALVRHLCARFLNTPRFPYGTLAVNVSGSFLLGCILGSDLPQTIHLLAGSGFLGAYTTFSTMKLECVRYLQHHDRKSFFAYLFCTYVLGIGSAFIGFAAAS
jgi:CrcB protein